MTNHDRDDDLPIGISAPARRALAGAGDYDDLTLEQVASTPRARGSRN